MQRLFLALAACAGLAFAVPAQALAAGSLALPAASLAPAATTDHATANPLVLDVRYHHRHHRHHHPHA